MTRENIEFSSVWIKEEGEYSRDYTLLTLEETGIGERARTAPGVTTIWGQNADNEFVELTTTQQAPGDTESFNIEFYGHYDVIQDLERYSARNVPFFLQLLSNASPPFDMRETARKVEHYRIMPGGLTLGAGRNRDASGGLRQNSITLNVTNRVDALLGIDLSRITNTNDTDALSVAVLNRNIGRETGYRGPDKVIFVGMNTDATNPGEIYVSINGGGTFAPLATDADPFTGVAGVNNLEWDFISQTQFRLFAARQTVSGAKAQFAYGNFTFGSEATAPTWVVVTIAATANDDAVEYLHRPKGIFRAGNYLYIGAASKIYISNDTGATDPGAAVATLPGAIAQIKADYARNVWAVSASNGIYVETASDRGVFVARTGPTSGGAFTAIDRAKNGIIFAGNGQYIYRNTNEARNAGGWTQLKDFGSGFTVKDIDCVGGSSEIIRVTVSSTTAGQCWYSFNGGLTWVQTTGITNGGYTRMAKTSDPNKYFVVGKVETLTPVIARWS